MMHSLVANVKDLVACAVVLPVFQILYKTGNSY